MAAPYTGNSIVDYLKSVGQDSSYNNRANIYKTSGINMGDYRGTAEQNTAVLNKLRGGGGSVPSPTPASSKPAAVVPSPQPAPAPVAAPMPRLDFINQANQNMVNVNNRLQDQSNVARDKLTNYYSNLEDPVTRYMRIRNEQGLPQKEQVLNALNTQILNLDDNIEGIDENVTKRAGDFFINEASRQALVNREKLEPIKQMNTLLKQKERESVGYDQSVQLVRDLINMAGQADEQGAKPLVLGVDFSENDRKIAMELMNTITNRSIQAYDADVTDAERRRSAEDDFYKKMAFEKYSSDLSQSRQIAVDNATKKNTTAEKTVKANNDMAWNQILAGANTEYDVWQSIMQNQDALRARGVDVDELWKKHAELAAEVGKGQSIRKASSGSTLDQFNAAMANYRPSQ